MSITITFPGGETATLKESTELTNKEIKTLRKSARVATSVALRLRGLGFDAEDPDTWTVATQLTDEDDDLLDIYQRNCVIMRLKSWSLDRPLPTTPEEVDDLPRPIFVPLTVAAADIKFNDDFGVSADPKALTESSPNSD